MKKILLILIVLLLVGSVFALGLVQNVVVRVLPGAFDVHSPVQDKIYDTKKILINVSTSSEVEYLKYSDNGKLKTLCKKCDSYSKKKSFSNGFHDMTIVGFFESGNVTHKVNFTVDNKKPKIKKTYPKKYSNGTFEVEYTEENLKKVTLFIEQNDEISGYTRDDCESGKKKSCEISVEELYQGKLYYWFEIEDIAGNKDESRKKRVEHDDIAPNFLTIVNPVNGTVYDGKVDFEIYLDEKADIEYTDDRGRWKNLKKNKDYVKKSKKYKEGSYTIFVKAEDKAENSRLIMFDVEVI